MLDLSLISWLLLFLSKSLDSINSNNTEDNDKPSAKDKEGTSALYSFNHSHIDIPVFELLTEKTVHTSDSPNNAIGSRSFFVLLLILIQNLCKYMVRRRKLDYR